VALTVIFEERVEIPLNIRSLADFRRWALSADFPQCGRIDFVEGRIEVDMSPEDFFCHGILKTEILGVLYRLVKGTQQGHLVCDRTRVSSLEADLSSEPDIVYISHDALAAGRARLVQNSTGAPGRYVELEGAPDIVVEIVSDSSIKKDTQRLPAAYFKAGVREFWLVDARGQTPLFVIHQPGDSGYHPVPVDADGFQKSVVFKRGFRLDGTRDNQGHWVFDLQVRDRLDSNSFRS